MGFRIDFRELFSFSSNTSGCDDSDQESVGGNGPIIGEKLNTRLETIAITEVQKSDSVHPLHMKAPTLFEHKSPSGRCFVLQLKGYRGYP